jgi:chorismate mutase/prephenate dehydratase
MTDPEVTRLRAAIRDVDRELVAAVNRRLELVAELKRYKAEHQMVFVDRARETALIEERLSENGGPLSDAGLRAFYVELLELIKRELDG